MDNKYLSSTTIKEYFEWARKNPVGKIPKDVSKEGAGENRIPLAHLANSLPVYLIFKDILKNNKKQKAKILDIGCGTGRSISYVKEVISNKNLNFFGIDYSKACISYAKTKYNKQGVSFKRYTGKILPFLNNSFDYIISSHVIEHIPAKNQPFYVAEISRILKKGGVCVIGAPNRKYCQDIFYINPNDVRKYRFILPHEHENYISEVHILFGNKKLFNKYNIWQTLNSYWRKLSINSVKHIIPSSNLLQKTKFELYSLLRSNSLLQDYMARIGTEYLINKMNVNYELIVNKTRLIKKSYPDNGDNYICIAEK